MWRFPAKLFQAPKIIFKSSKLIGQKSLSYGHLLQDKRLKVNIFDWTNLSRLATWECITSERLKSPKNSNISPLLSSSSQSSQSIRGNGNQNVSVDIFVSDTSIARSLHLPGLEKKSYKIKNVFVSFFKNWRTHTIFLDQISGFLIVGNPANPQRPVHPSPS